MQEHNTEPLDIENAGNDKYPNDADGFSNSSNAYYIPIGNEKDHVYRNVIEQLPVGVANLSPEGLVLYCNRSFVNMLGIPADKIIGSSITQYVIPKYLPKFVRLVDKCGHADLG